MYDLIIIGAGPAGLAASIYASCYHLKHLIISRDIGGQMLLAPDILNYPGFESISGKDLTSQMFQQAKNRGGEILTGGVTGISHMVSDGVRPSSNSRSDPDINDEGYAVETQEGERYQARAIILATGTERRKLNIPGEVEYTARGVHYCATCEKFDYEGKVCAVVGGANSAVQAAVELAQAASKVYIFYRGSQLRGDPIWLEQIGRNPNIEVVYNVVVSEIVGDGQKVTGVRLKSSNEQIKQVSDKNTSDGGPDSSGTPPRWRNQSELPLDKLFVEIGGVPGTALVIPIGVKMDPGGYIKVDEHLATTAPGVFAAGDLVSYGLSIEQISSAVGLGARAAASAFAYIKGEKSAPTLWGGSQIKR